MREIKFRAFGTKGHTPTDGKWCYGSNIVSDCYGETKKDNHFPLTIFERYLQGNYYDKNTRCQFTGLIDKNGVEIYEGDILAGCNGSINGNGWNWGNYSVSFKDGKFDVPLWGTFERHDNTHWFEVIGNIYEHPHLLKEETMLREVIRLTKGDLSNVKRPLHVKKKAEPNAGILKGITLPLPQLLKHKLKGAQCKKQ